MKLLIVEDDLSIANQVKSALMAENHIVELALDGAEGSFLGRSYEYDAIVLDYSLPKKDGLVVCKEIRASGKSTPIIFLSVTDDSEMKIAALNQGADDYMTKPFVFNELHARLRAVHRRPTITTQPELVVDDLVLNSDKQTVTRDGKEIRMTRKEFNILEDLMNHRGNVASRALLMERVWTADSDPFSNTVETHIGTIRKKISCGGKTPLIVTVPGRGYTIE